MDDVVILSAARTHRGVSGRLRAFCHALGARAVALPSSAPACPGDVSRSIWAASDRQGRPRRQAAIAPAARVDRGHH